MNTSTDKKLPETEALAEAFIRLLRETIGDEDYAKVVALNAAELNPDVCASGDFCDSNMVMDAAFKTRWSTATPKRTACRRRSATCGTARGTVARS